MEPAAGRKKMTRRIMKPVLVLIMSLSIGIGSAWGDTPVVKLPLIEFKGQKQDPITFPMIVYQGATVMRKPNLMKRLSQSAAGNRQPQRLAAIPGLVLTPQPVQKVFSIASRVPLKVFCNRNPGHRLLYKFQRRQDGKWRTDRSPRLLGPARRKNIGQLAITRQAKFAKAGRYRWRCRAGNKGNWSSWSPEVVITAPGVSAVKGPVRPSPGSMPEPGMQTAD